MSGKFLTLRQMLDNLVIAIPDSNVTCFRVRHRHRVGGKDRVRVLSATCEHNDMLSNAIHTNVWGLKFVWSSESAPIRIQGGSPVSNLKLSKAL